MQLLIAVGFFDFSCYGPSFGKLSWPSREIPFQIQHTNMNFWEFREPGSRDSRRFVCLISIKFFSFITERVILGLNNATLRVVTILVTMAPKILELTTWFVKTSP